MLQEGDIINLEAGMSVYADVPKHFVYANKRGIFDLTHVDIILGKDFDYLCGKYIVYKTVCDGGGVGAGSFDTYPNGHHVFCVKTEDANVKVDFYQSGCFTAMIQEVEVIGKAQLRWTD